MDKSVEKVEEIKVKLEDLLQDVKDCSVLNDLETFDEVKDALNDAMHSLDQMRLELLGW